MLNLKDMRARPEYHQAGFDRRGFTDITVAQILEKEQLSRLQQQQLQNLQQQKNDTAKQISKATYEERPKLIQQGEQIKTELQQAQETFETIKTELDSILTFLPNCPHPSVPTGKDEQNNIEMKKIGTPRTFDFTPLEHHLIGISKEQMDFDTAAKVSGSRFVYLKGTLARLHRAIGQFFLDTLTEEFGYTEMYTPYLVRAESMFGTAQHPKFTDDQFETTDGRWLIPTSEVSLTNYVREELLSLQILPLRFTTLSPCFRKEVGAAGKDLHGMIRQHQFYKVEMVSITDKSASYDELERMVSIASALLQKLDLPHRIMTLCTGDMGIAAAKTYDLEVWLPSQNGYREISSCSNCEDFQARRMMTRYKDVSGENQYCHTLNGSGLAVGRTLIAILENYQNKDGSITIPDTLKKYMSIDVLPKTVQI
ncbi:MAG: serine--tRNA ligase [Pseudomonadota bacterium]